MRDNLTREGEIGEMRVQLDLTQQGYVVSVPLSASTNGYDLICDTKTRLLKIQVKSMKQSTNNTVTVPLINRKNSSVAKNNRGQTHRYSELVDYIAITIKNTDQIYYISSEELPADKTSETFLLHGYKGASKKKFLTEKHKRIY